MLYNQRCLMMNKLKLFAASTPELEQLIHYLTYILPHFQYRYLQKPYRHHSDPAFATIVRAMALHEQPQYLHFQNCIHHHRHHLHRFGFHGLRLVKYLMV